MNKQDIIDVLTAVRAGDNRTVGQGDVEMWHLVIGKLNKDQALQAVIEHRQERPGTWLEPGHILQIVRNHQRDTTQRADPPLSIETPTHHNPNNIGIEKRILTTGADQYRFFTDDTCGRWRDTREQAVNDGIRHTPKAT